MSDVLAGAAIGATAGDLADRRTGPLLLAPLPGGVFVGIHKRF